MCAGCLGQPDPPASLLGAGRVCPQPSCVIPEPSLSSAACPLLWDVSEPFSPLRPAPDKLGAEVLLAVGLLPTLFFP
jgi:hypothetical protein